MDSLRRILKSALDDRSPRFILATIALGVVVALLAGTLIGYKLDNRNGTSTSAAKTTTAKKSTAKKVPVLLGTVVAARPARIGVLSVGKRQVPFVITARTGVEVAGPGSSSSITVGSHVLYAAQPGSTTTAAEVVVLPPTSRLGTAVTAVSPTSMTLSTSVVVTTGGATVSTTAAANRTQIRVGSHVAVAYVASRRAKTAIEVAILPAGSRL